MINKLREFIIQTGLFTESEMLSECHQNLEFEKLYKMRTFNQSFEKAKNLAAQRILDEPLTGLFRMCKQRTWPTDLYYSVDASVCIVHMIMDCNGIPMGKFVRDAVDLMDKRRPKVNCLWLHGTTNAGKSYLARSFERLATLFHSVPPGSNRFMFQDCVNRRLIVLNEPYLDESSIEAVKEVLEGQGCYVPVKQKADQWLRSTPVIITSNTLLWQFNSQARNPLLSRCFPGYMNMRSCSQLAKAKKELHPLWLERAMEAFLKPSPESPVPNDLVMGEDSDNDMWDDTIDLNCKEKMPTEEEFAKVSEIPLSLLEKEVSKVIEDDPFEKELERNLEIRLNKEE